MAGCLRRLVPGFALASCALFACNDGGTLGAAPAAAPRGTAGMTAAELPPPPAASARPAFCDRPGDDAVRDKFCAGSVSPIGSLRELQTLLDVEPAPADMQPNITDPFNVKFVIALGHSTALSGHFVSPINPRVLVLGKETVTAFQRGVQHVELASLDRSRTDRSYIFYLVSFEQACTANAAGCSNADLFTPRLESDWTALEIHDEEELKNTTSDCRQCHRRSGDSGVLLMRELRSPWAHWFETIPTTDTGLQLPGARGSDLMKDYIRAKGEESYGGAAVHAIPPTSALVLQSSVSIIQPLLFDSRAIEDERWPYGPEGYPRVPNPSPTWQNAYAAFKRGEQLALPYFDQRATDPDKQAQLTEAYAKYRAGELRADELPDLADIFPDDPYVRAQIGLQTEPGASAPEALIQACGSCHNDVLDQSISRARFNIDLSKLEPAELEIALDRLRRPTRMRGAMPPPEGRQLDPEARARLITYLEQAGRSRDSEPMLEHAAKVGMTGGASTGYH
jgi:cytochrome c553